MAVLYNYPALVGCGFRQRSDREDMSAGSSKVARVFEADELLNNLKLSEEEKEGLFLAKEKMGSLPMVKWMAVRRF
jgi:hypothetical protein